MPTKSASKTITRDPNWPGPAIPPGEILLEEYLKSLGLGQRSGEAARHLAESAERDCPWKAGHYRGYGASARTIVKNVSTVGSGPRDRWLVPP
jgi:hypothetical protein